MLRGAALIASSAAFVIACRPAPARPVALVAASPRQRAIVFLVGESPVVTVSAAAPGGVPRVFRDRAAYDAALDALPSVDVVVEGPQSSRSPVVLGAGREVRTSGPQGDVYTWAIEPFSSRVVSLTRAMKPGHYRVLLANGAGLRLTVSPTEFDVVAGRPAPVVALPTQHLEVQGPVAMAAAKAGVFVATELSDGAVAVEHPGAPGRIRIPDARAPRLAASPEGLALAYVSSRSEPRLALLDFSLQLRKTVELDPGGGATYEPGVQAAPLVNVLWNPEQGEWAVAWTSDDKLTAAEMKQKRDDGEMIRPDEHQDRLRFARVAPGGTVLETRRLGEGQALALARAGQGYAMITPSPASALPCGLRLVTFVGGAVTIGPTAQVPRCEFPRVALARNDGGFVAVLPGCPRSDGGRELIALDFDNQGKVPPESTLLLDDAADRGFDVIEDRGHAWLAYATIEARTARTQVLLEPLGADVRPKTAFVLQDGYDPVRGVQFGGPGSMSALLVVREATTSVLDLTPFADVRGLPQVRPVVTRSTAACSN